MLMRFASHFASRFSPRFTIHVGAATAWHATLIGAAVAVATVSFSIAAHAQTPASASAPVVASIPAGTTTLGHIQSPVTVPNGEAAMIEQGRLLAVAADCMACHTAIGGEKKAFSGGYPIASPMGTIWSTNITPSTTAGIGRYTEPQFADALRRGIRADGAHLYPAMPYTSYARLTDADVHALYTYFMKGVPAVDTPAPETKLPFPFNIRLSMMFWNALYLKHSAWVSDPAHSVEWNRGAYITNALGHCDACHTPRNVLMAEDEDRAFAGAQLGAWYAPDISSDPVSGIGAWTNQEIVQYLKTGHVAGKNQAAGGMAEAVQNSLQFMSLADLQAVAVYLKSTKPMRNWHDTQPAFSYGANPGQAAQADDAEATWRGAAGNTSPDSVNKEASGAALYLGNCASCHGVQGKGSRNQAYPSLINNTATGASDPSNLLATILYGVDRKVGDEHVLMPAFGQNSYVSELNNAQIAKIANYVLQQYGNPADKVSEDDVQTARDAGPRPFLAQFQPYIVPSMIGVLLLVFILLIVGWQQRYRHQRARQRQR